MDNRENLTTADIRNFLQRRLGDKEAHEVMDYLQTEIEARVADGTREIKEQAEAWRNELKNEFVKKSDFGELQKKLVGRVSKVEWTIILWGFVFCITIILAFFVIIRFVK